MREYWQSELCDYGATHTFGVLRIAPRFLLGVDDIDDLLRWRTFLWGFGSLVIFNVRVVRLPRAAAEGLPGTESPHHTHCRHEG